MRPGHLGLGQAVHRGLEFFAMVELRGDPEKVEGALEERDLGIEAREADIPHRLQPDLIERRGEIIGPRPRSELAKAVGKGQGKLAFRPKGSDRVAQFLNFAKTELVVADPRKKAFDARVYRRGLHPIQDVAQCRLAADEQPQQAILMRSFSQPMSEVDAEDDVAGKRGYRRLQPADQQYPA